MMPASTAPISGAIQNSQSCASAQPPTKIAGPVLRAGFTEVLVTGMLIRWIRVSPRPMAIGAKPWRRPLVGGPENDHQEHERQHHLGDEAGRQGVAARGVLAIAVGGESAARAETRPCRWR